VLWKIGANNLEEPAVSIFRREAFFVYRERLHLVTFQQAP
jgi:hypothetical protein